MDGFIYKITNDINNKIYIGKTLSSIEKRFAEHKKESARIQEQIRPLYRAMNKYGCEHFSIEIIETSPIETLSEREKYWIEYFDSFKNGYNATIGGDGKQLYDYDAIVRGFLSGKLVYELAEEFGCCVDVIRTALNLANLDSRLNADKKVSKGIVAKTMSGQIIQEFPSRKDAVKWLQDNEYTASNNRDNIIATIGRVANGQRKSAYGMKWENLY